MLGSFIFFMILAGAAFGLGWVSQQTFWILAGLLVFLTILSAILKYPWDLFFQARHLVDEQNISTRKGIFVSLEDQKYAKQMEKRLLFLCLFIHVLVSSIFFVLAWYFQVSHAYLGAALLLISAAVRPLFEFYIYQKRRFLQMIQNSRIPREDQIELKTEITELKRLLQEQAEGLAELRKTQSQSQEKSETGIQDLYGHYEKLSYRQEENTKIILHEFEKSIEKLTADQDVLRGIRALVQLIKVS